MVSSKVVVLVTCVVDLDVITTSGGSVVAIDIDSVGEVTVVAEPSEVAHV